MEPLGPATAVGPTVSNLPIQVGDHVCGFYRSETEFGDLMGTYVGDGLIGNHKCTVILDGIADSAFDSYLMRRQVDGRLFRTSGRLEVLTSDDFYLASGAFSPERTLARLEERMSRAEQEGFSLYRVLGHMNWVRRRVPGTERLLEYEAGLNALMPRYRQVTFCLYDISACTGEMVIQLLRTHPKVFLNGNLIENPYYVAPEQFLKTFRVGGTQ